MQDLISTLPVVTTAILGIFALFKDYQHDKEGRKLRWLSKSGVFMLVLILITMGGSLYALHRDGEQSDHLIKEVAQTRTEIKSQVTDEMGKLKAALEARGMIVITDGSLLGDPKFHPNTRGGERTYKTLDLEAVAKEYARLKAEADASPAAP